MARRFRFRLKTVLRVRQLRETEGKRKVAAQRAELARLNRLDRETADEIARQQAELLDDQRAGLLDPAALQRGRAWIAHLRRTVALRYRQRTEMVAQLQQLQAAWQAARTQARIIEKLRQRRFAEYRRERSRQEQTALDELAQQLPSRDLALETGNRK